MNIFHLRSLAILSVLLLGAGCAPFISESEPSAPVAAESEPLTIDAVEAMTIAEDDLNVDERFELSSHTTYFATSPDGIAWTLREDPIAHYASVPELVALGRELGPFPPGALLSYFVDGTQDHGSEDVALGLVYSLDGGETWSNRLYTTMTGQPRNTVAVDPSLVQLEDGRLRLYYFDFSTKKDAYEIHTAVSEDGVNFTYEALAFVSPTRITDPDLAFFKDAWHMYTMSEARAGMQVAISGDPLSFDETVAVNDRGIPGVITVGEEIWLFSCGQNGLTRLTSSDGITFTLAAERLLEVSPGVHCDPSPVQLEDGTFAMVFKHIRQEDMRQPPVQPPKP
jgi:hypothetical protein